MMEPIPSHTLMECCREKGISTVLSHELLYDSECAQKSQSDKASPVSFVQRATEYPFGVSVACR